MIYAKKIVITLIMIMITMIADMCNVQMRVRFVKICDGQVPSFVYTPLIRR